MKQFLLPAPPDRDGLVRIRGGDFHYLVHVRRLRPGDRFKALLPGRGAGGLRSVLPPGAGGEGEGGREAALLLEVRSAEGGTLIAAVLGAPAGGGPGEDSGAAVASAVASGSASSGAAAAASGVPSVVPSVASSGAAAAASGVPSVVPSAALPPILLFQALPKGSKMDLIVRQAAEGALSEVVPFVAERSLARGEDPSRRGERRRRWERIIREALQQSGSGVPTALHATLDGEGLFAYWEELRAARPGALGIFFHQDLIRSGAFPGPLAPMALHRYLSEVPDVVALAVGPEGGFSPAEVDRFLGAGFKPFTIGDTVLRTETAALYGAAAARIILLESASWTQTSR